MGLIAVVFMLYQGHAHSEATPTEAFKYWSFDYCQYKSCHGLRAGFKNKTCWERTWFVGYCRAVWRQNSITANVVQARQIHAYTVCWHHTHMRPLGSGCTMATRECVYVSIDVCVLYMSLLVGCIGRWCVYEGICLVDAFKALGVLHRHQKLLAQVFKRLVRREVQAIKAEREENGTIKEITIYLLEIRTELCSFRILPKRVCFMKWKWREYIDALDYITWSNPSRSYQVWARGSFSGVPHCSMVNNCGPLEPVKDHMTHHGPIREGAILRVSKGNTKIWK